LCPRERAPAIVDAPPTERDTPTTAEPLPPASEPEPAAVAKPTDARPRPTRTGKRRVEPAVVEPKSTEPTRTTTLEAEMRLLARANAAMRAGQHRDALAVLDEHARDYARGQLAPEREYKRAVVLCELGRRDEARAAADAFVRAHPRSPLRAKAEGVCREEDPR